MSFRFLEHTADVLFEAENTSFETALADAAGALSATAGKGVKKKEEFEFEESAVDVEELVVAVLSRLLSEAEVRGLLPGGLKVMSFKEEPERTRVKVIAWVGAGVQKTIIKGVTYGMLKVERKPGRCTIKVLLDI